MKLSTSGQYLLKQLEGGIGPNVGAVLTPYLDPPNNNYEQYSIGYGFLLVEDGSERERICKGVFGDNFYILKQGAGIITQAQADEAFARIVVNFEAKILSRFPVSANVAQKLDQDQWDALVIRIWNAGNLSREIVEAIFVDVWNPKLGELLLKPITARPKLGGLPVVINSLIKRRQIEKDLYFKNAPDNISTFDDVKETERLGAGIWQIIDFVIDEEVKNRQINDVSIAFNSGSLLNFVNKVCLQPLVEFFGDTYGDKYYFIARKPPFNRQSFNSLYTINITDEDVYNEDLHFNNDETYSWYQLIPQGYFISSDNIYQRLPAFFFNEYAEIWGSKPLVITTNYNEFLNNDDKTTSEQKVLDDLRFIIETNCYLPFTRKGTLVIKQNRKIKRGMRIYYQPTNEFYHVDGVQQSAVSQEGTIDVNTVLQVSRGMIKEYCEPEIKNSNTRSYFNIVNFDGLGGDTERQQKIDMVAEIKDINGFCYFNSLQTKLLSAEEEQAINDTLHITDENLVDDKQRDSFNKNIIKVVDWLFKYKGVKFKVNGYYDMTSDAFNYGQQRAEFVKNKIIASYNFKYPADLELTNRLITSSGSYSEIGEPSTTSGRASNRRVDLTLDFETVDEGNIELAQNKTWHVNKRVFEFFVKRLQLA